MVHVPVDSINIDLPPSEFQMLNALFLANEQTSNWLTPVWLVALGFVGGFLLFGLFWLVVYFLTRVPGINRINESKPARLGVGLLLTGVFFALGMWLANQLGWFSTDVVASANPEARVDSQTEAGYSLLLAIIALAVTSPFAGFGLVAIASARRRDEVLSSPWDGPLYWLNWICAGSALFAVLGIGLWSTGGLEIFTIVDQPDQFMRSMVRLPSAGTYSKYFEIPVSADDDTGTTIDVSFNGSEIRWIQFESEQPLAIAAEAITKDLPELQVYRHATGTSGPWLTQASMNYETPIPQGPVQQLFVVNQGDSPTRLRVWWHTEPEFLQVAIVPMIAVFVACIYVFVMLLVALAPKITAVALATFKTESSQPIFLILVLFGLIFMLASVFIPYFTFGEDIKMYQDAGLTVIRVLGIFLAIWAASKSIAEEIEGRTALTVLSKPIGRVQFVLGKFLGILGTVGLLLLLLGLWFTIWTAFKPIYDTVETAERVFNWRVCFGYVVANIPALILIFFECILFVSISVAISTRVGILPNFLICFSIYVMGHLTASLVASKEVGSIELVAFFGRLISIIFPVLDHFDASTAIMTSTVVPFNYLAWTALYTLLYGTIMLLLSLLLFQDRDLA